MYLTTKPNALLLNEFFRDFWNESNALPMRSDIYLENDDCVIDIELPGVKKENVNISFKDEYLTISVEQNKERETKYSLRERNYSNTSRSYYLGDVDEKTIKASFKDGILSIRFPKEQKKVEKNHTIVID